MTGNEGGAARRRPLVRQGGGRGESPHIYLDHVLVPVLDLDAAGARFLDLYGLQSLAGGVHPTGTANRIIPLGRTYIELIAVVDAARAAESARGRRIGEAAQAGRPFATWAARTEDLGGLRESFERRGMMLPPVNHGSRTRPDGVTLEWKSQELVLDAQPSVLPFLIEWHVPAGQHPAETPAEHRSGAGDIVFARFQAPDPESARQELTRLLGENLEFAVDEGSEPALVEVGLERPGVGRLAIP